MLFPRPKRTAAPGVKICFNDNSDAGRRIFYIDIKDVRKWRDAFKPQRLDIKADRRRQNTRTSTGQRAIANSSFVICNQKDTPTPEREPESMGSESPCDSLIFTREKMDLFGDTKYNGTVDTEMIAERAKTERILEGQSDGPSELPAYHPSQRAFLIVRKLRGRFLVTCSVRNINACSHAELLKLMWQMEMNGWNDMIYVTQKDEEVPYRIESKEKTEVLEWGRFEDDYETPPMPANEARRVEKSSIGLQTGCS
ncbi:uncharacterized protein FSUBG_3277 [Fusarium subglutinans]|uniref:Uncharacterized protein n=1 Tax=Gibberella subglutinans TaxID=42677 RepID=A0A8H5Q729_GIBSU|nr:uncharacterized protein FSUBG_3277 [Fusarium subglutinans]KAF5610361.1 hypothetical protein FSUBG_3277 [Fusarium subglutinans]